jgi:1-acyl-sn-glycerol-3-phosphate acyltransferase
MVPNIDGFDVARRGNFIAKCLARLVLAVTGWRITGELPDRRKFVAIVAPHTSNWDWLLGMVLMFAVGVKFSFLIKSSVFVPVFGSVLKWLGGIPIDRSRNGNTVETAVQAFDEAERLILVITPEGTRKSNGMLRKGFYRIAQGANAPVLLTGLNYPEKRMDLGPVLEIDLPEDEFYAKTHEYFGTMRGKHAGYLGSD